MELSQKLAKLEKLARKLGIKIISGKQNYFLGSHNIISLNMRQKPLKRAWALAHELGHARTHGKIMKELGTQSYTCAEHTWPALEAEFRAWRIADKLLRKLDLYDKAYLMYKHSCLRSYYLSK